MSFTKTSDVFMSAISVGPVTLAQFNKVGLTIAQATSVIKNQKAHIPAYLVNLDLGSALLKEHKALNNKESYISSAQLCSNHLPEEIAEQLLMCIYNFPRKQIGSMKSDCLVTGAQKLLEDPDKKRETTVFMKPSTSVVLGSKIGLCAEDEVYSTNSRSLTWDDFTALNLRIGTIVSACLVKHDGDSTADPKQRYLMNFKIDLGADGIKEGVGFLRSELIGTNFLNKQLMVLTNLDSSQIAQLFDGSTASVVLCTVAGRAFLKPAKLVDNGYKIA